MLRQVKDRVYLIVDAHPVHRSASAKKFVAENVKRLRLIRLPGYCHELNPDELLNQDVKTNARVQEQTGQQDRDDRYRAQER